MQPQIRQFIPPVINLITSTGVATQAAPVLTVDHPLIHLNDLSAVDLIEFTQFLHCVFMTRSRFRWFRSEVHFTLSNPISYWNEKELSVAGTVWDIEYFMRSWYQNFLSATMSMYRRAGWNTKEGDFYEALLWHTGTLSARGERYFDGNN